MVRAMRTLLLVIASAALCSAEEPARSLAVPLDAVPTVTLNRTSVPLGSPMEITYSWRVDKRTDKPARDYRALLRFRDAQGILMFDDDHVPVPPARTWRPGQTYRYTRTVFVPIYPYVGKVLLGAALYPGPRDGARPENKFEGKELQERSVGEIELLPQVENIFLVYKDGWHSPESSAQNPGQERTWTTKEALVAFKNPKKDILIYLEADTNVKAFDAPPVLTVAVAGKTGVNVPIADSEIFMKKVRVKAADLGTEEWVDLRLSMNQSFVPKVKNLNAMDDRELGLMVYHLFVGEADALGQVEGVVDAGPVTVPTAPAAATAPAKPAPAPAKPAVKSS